MSSVTFSTTVGGDGSTVTDDNNATTGLRDGGWKTRFIPCFTQQVAVANYIVTKAGEASTSASAASASATAAAASYDSFDDRYLGAKTSDPSLDNDGNALITGAIYWNSSTSVMKVWSGSAWVSYNPAISYLPLSGGTMTGAITFASSQFGANISTFLATPSSANLAAALTDETGSGVNVFSNTPTLVTPILNSPTLVTPVLGTPTSGNLSNCTNAIAYGLKSSTTTVSISAATAPTEGQVLTAINDNSASWQFNSGLTFVASGTLPSGSVVYLNNDGTVSSASNNTATVGTSGSIPGTYGSGTIVTSCYDAVNSKIVVFFSSSSVTYGIIGTVSGTTISFGTAVAVNTSSFITGDCCYIGSGKVFICYDTGGTAVKGRIGTISGTTISFGTENTLLTGINGDISCDYDSISGKVAVAFRNTGTNGQFSLVTISGTTFTFANSTFSASAITKVSLSCDGLGNAIILYTGASSGVYAVIAAISGSTVTFSSVLSISSLTALEVEAIYFPSSNSFIIGFSSASFTGMNLFEIKYSGTFLLNYITNSIIGNTINAISFSIDKNNSLLISHNYGGSSTAFYNLSCDDFKSFTLTTISGVNDGTSTSINLIYDPVNKNNVYVSFANIYRVINLAKFNNKNVIGISAGSYTTGQNANVFTSGNKTSTNSGLSANSNYYVNEITGAIQTTKSAILIGLGLSATSLLVR